MVRFDGRNPRAEEWLRQTSSRLVTEIIEDQRQALRGVLRDGMQEGRNPRTVALEIVGRVNRATGKREGGLLGLTSGQMEWVQNARADLSSGDPARLRNYLGRKARDARFDRTVRKGIDAGKIAAADVTRIVEAYERKLLKYRGDTIGRTEALRSINASKHEGLLQVVENGKVRADQITRVWDSSGADGRTRDTHLAMEGQKVALNEPFVTPTGFRLMYPGDTSLGAPASETIQCRCVTQVRIDFLADAA